MSERKPQTRSRIRPTGRAHAREQGSALLVSMVLLAVMGLIGFASLETVTRDRQTAGFQSRAQTALYAADAGVSDGLEILKNEVVGSALAPGDCLVEKLTPTTLANATNYGPDSTAPTDEICMLASADPCSAIDASVEVGQPIYLNTIWNIRTEGTAAGGASARIHATARRCHAFNN